ncbi:MAG: PilZ domain-containing protein [Candidatus Hydrogenedentes bacterium]|nr:PilZ domain-containing protein [Candidatus Hydrogenedentota bacterium]
MPAAYTIDMTWDDPYEHREDRRKTPRAEWKRKISIAVDNPAGKGRLVGPGLVMNLSSHGVLVNTKHRLQPQQPVTVAMPTEPAPNDMCLPEVFAGPATVVRVEALDDRHFRVALRFGETLSQNMEFAMFVDFMQTVVKALGA